MDRSANVIIVGAGLSGLVTAYELHKYGIEFLLLESRERIGGRIHTLSISDDSTLELGATWFADKHSNLMSLIRELQIDYQPQYTGKNVLYDFANPERQTQLIQLPLGQQPSYVFSNGSGSLVTSLLNRIPKDTLLLGERINQIAVDNGEFALKSQHHQYTSKYIINTLPPNLAVSSMLHNPALPSDLVSLAKQTHTWMGESIKVGLLFKEAFWRKDQIGVFFSQFGPIQELHDHMHVETGVPILKGFLSPAVRSHGADQLKQEITLQLKQYFADDQAIPERVITADWQKEENTYHPYEHYVGPHQYNGHFAFRNSLYDGKYHFGGSETAESFPGYMDGAVERAKEVSRTISLELGA